MKDNQPPTGIIRTLPLIYANKAHEAYKGFHRTIAAMERDPDTIMFFALPSRPKHELLHFYVLVDGLISIRFLIAGFKAGEVMECWDGTTRTPGAIAICNGPVSRPRAPIPMRGFRGFRYTQDLW